MSAVLDSLGSRIVGLEVNNGECIITLKYCKESVDESIVDVVWKKIGKRIVDFTFDLVMSEQSRQQKQQQKQQQQPPSPVCATMIGD